VLAPDTCTSHAACLRNLRALPASPAEVAGEPNVICTMFFGGRCSQNPKDQLIGKLVSWPSEKGMESKWSP